MKRRNFLKLIPVLASLPLVSRLIPAKPSAALSQKLEENLVAYWKLTGTAGADAAWQLSTEDLAAIAEEMIDGAAI